MKKISRIALTICVLLFGSFIRVNAQSSDNGDGTFTNPVLWADFPDPDIIRVENKYYMVSTSMHYFPGVTVMESTDLVNWGIAANAVEEFKFHPFYDMNGGNRYAKGQWATSIRYFNGKFHLLFTTLTEGSFMCVADKATGPWAIHKIDNAFLYDPGLFVDTDGRVYVIHGNTDISLTEMTADGLRVKSEAKQIYKAHKPGLEGNHCYKIGEYYYIYCTYGGPLGNQVCLRSKSLNGPFEERVVMNDEVNYAQSVLHQATLIDLPDGSYWAMIFQDHGGLGRIPFLVPVTWVDKWPVLGNMMDGNVTFKKPIAGGKRIDFPTTDEFNSKVLSQQWQFNHNPDKTKYSLKDSKGFLRLYAATATDSIMHARNTLCQRIFGPHSEGTAKLDLSNMKIGDKAGLMIIQDPNATITVSKTKNAFELQMTKNDVVLARTTLKKNVVYLRAKVNGISDKVNFYYSTDNEEFLPIGEEFKMEFRLTIFCGNRYGLFNYSTNKLGGWVDFDWFRINHEPLLNHECYEGKDVEAEFFDHKFHAGVRLSKNDRENRNQDVVFEDGGLISFYKIKSSKSEINKVELLLECTSPNAVLELRCRETGKSYGKFSIPASSEKYQSLSFQLDGSFSYCAELEFIVRKPSKSGVVAIDKFKFLGN